MFHLRGRKVSRTEHLLHAGIGIALAALFIQSVAGHQLAALGALLLFALAGGVDEYIYHRGIPAEESDLHAKEHLALIVFLAVSLATGWLEKHGWNLSQLPALWRAGQGKGA